MHGRSKPLFVVVFVIVGIGMFGASAAAAASAPSAVRVVVAPVQSEAAPPSTPTSSPDGANASGNDDGDSDVPSTGQLWVAALAVAGAIALGIVIVAMVIKAHAAQRQLAASAIRRGQEVKTVGEPAAPGSGNEVTVEGADVAPAPPPLEVTSPAILQLGVPGEYRVSAEAVNPTWTVDGIDSFAMSRADPHRFVLTPQEVKPAVTVTVHAEGATDVTTPALPVEPAEPANQFVVRLFVRNWGLIVVAIVIVFGAIALGLTGALDGGNFVALVAPLAALLGVTAAGGSKTTEAETTPKEGG